MTTTSQGAWSPAIKSLPGNPGAFSVEAREEAAPESGVAHLRLTIRFPGGRIEPVLLEWFEPLLDIAGKWHCSIGADRSLTAEWTKWMESYATHNAPVMCAFSSAGENRLTFALSDAINPVKLQMQVEEDTAELRCRALLASAPMSPVDEYTVVLRVDRRPAPWQRALADVARWWEGDHPPAAVPPAGLEPVYSTWYGFHQNLTPEAVEAECGWAAGLGCGAVIVDDGWQCDDLNKGYDFCGDWEVARSKFPDFPAHVARVRALGMKYLLWFSVPYVGLKSAAWARFQDRTLDKPFANAACLDPRYPGVRAMLIECYRRAVEEWGVDGLKLDFVDQFTAVAPGRGAAEAADLVSVPEAADRLLTDVMAGLRRSRPDILIEFRQKYVGPAMRRYGNLFRANDCPNDGLSNRVRTIDTRLLAGGSAVHSDMIMWHRDESPERVAAQLWAALFSVPQISVRRAAITGAHEEVLRFFLAFWREHRDVLLHGELEPLAPLELYPVVRASDAHVMVVACYAVDRVIELPSSAGGNIVLVNATDSERVVVRIGEGVTWRVVKTLSCLGLETPSTQGGLAGLRELHVPPSGVCVLAMNEGSPGL